MYWRTSVIIFALCAATLFAQEPSVGGGDAPVIGQRFGLPLTAEQRTALMEEITASGDKNVSLSNALLYKGLALFNEKEYALCVPYLEEALTLDPTMASGWEGLGWAYVRLGEKEMARTLWQRMLQLMPDRTMPHNLLAQLAIMDQDWPQADTMFRKSLNIDPAQPEVRLWFSQNLLRIGNYREAERIVRALLRDDPGRFDIKILLARMLAYQQEFDEASELWREIVKELPDNPNLLMDAATVELQVGEIQHADEICQQVLQIEPKNTRALMLRADLADISDMADLTISRLQELIEIVPEMKTKAALRIRLATRCRALNERKIEDPPYRDSYIIEQYEKAIEDDPECVAHYLTYADVCIYKKEFSKARELATKVLEQFNRHNVHAKDILFSAEIGLGHFDRADQILADRYGNFEKNNAYRFYKKAQLLMARGEFEQALHQLDNLEACAAKGCVFTLLYHQLTESDWMPMTSVRRLHEHLSALKQEGFELISPTDIPKVLNQTMTQTNGVSAGVPDSLPLPARMVDSIWYSFTGERRKHDVEVKPEASVSSVPKKYIAVTFDGGSRSALKLGLSVAEELNVPFGMFVNTKDSVDYAPNEASWREIKEYAQSGFWLLGSNLEDAHELQPVNGGGPVTNLVRALPNRLWVAEKNRLESMNEWDKRMRKNFRLSRSKLREKLLEDDSPIAMVSYPFGDVGQEDLCNISSLRNVTQSIMSEASRNYQIGFVNSANGYSCAGDDQMLLNRYEPQWFDEGADIVRQVYLSHPLILARLMRISIAQRQNKPHLAKEMVALLKRDGYPADLCRELEVETVAHFTRRPIRKERPLVLRNPEQTEILLAENQKEGEKAKAQERPAMPHGAQDTYSADQRAMGASNSGSMPDRQNIVVDEEDRPWFDLDDPYLGAEVWDTKANGEFSQTRYGFMGGLKANQRSTFGIEFFETRIKQDMILTTKNRAYNTGAPVSYTNQVNTSSNATYYATRQDVRGRFTHTFDSGALLAASLGQASMTFERDRSSSFYLKDSLDGYGTFEPLSSDDNSRSFIVGDLGFIFYPIETLMLRTYYIHDLVTSAYDFQFYDSVGFNAKWMFTDSWHVGFGGQYWIYDDGNSMGLGQIDSFWNVVPDMGVWMGLEGMIVTSAKNNSYYWTPYWDERLNYVLRYRMDYDKVFLNFDAIVGLQRELSRANSTLATGQDWEPGFGFASSYNRRFWTSFDLYLELRTMFLHSYSDHSIRAGGVYTF